MIIGFLLLYCLLLALLIKRVSLKRASFNSETLFANGSAYWSLEGRPFLLSKKSTRILGSIFVMISLFSSLGYAKPPQPGAPNHKASKALGWQPHTPKVIVTIKPIHSLVAGVMEGIAIPELMIQDNSSPHVHAIKPSEAARLQEAEVIVWVGAIYESGLKNRLANLAEEKIIIDLSKGKNVKLLPQRQGGFWGKGECCHSCPSCDKEEPEACAHDHHSHGEPNPHESLSKDGHLWLAPDNAKAIVTHVAETLAALDPQHAADYLANSKKMVTRLNELAEELTDVLAIVKDKPYMMVHDFSQYFDSYFGTQGVGTILTASHGQPTPQFLQTIKKNLQEENAQCLVVEPQFPLKVISMLVEETKIAHQEIDYLGGDLEEGPNCYFEIMRRLANNLRKCLS